MFKSVIFLLLFIFLVNALSAQMAYRVKADILTKTRLPDSTFQVSKGLMYYDKNHQKITFDFTFPEKERVVLFDTIMYQYRNNELLTKSKNFLIPRQSFFHFILSGNLSNFGFDEANFTAKGIEKQKDLIITTWIPPEGMEQYLSKILIASKNKRLHSITIFDGESNVKNRQILKDYRLIDGLEIPQEVLIATYLDEGPMFQIIQLKNVVLNEDGNEAIYDFKL